MDGLNNAAVTLIEKNNVADSIYSDSVVNTLVPMLAGLIPSNTAMVGSNMTPAMVVSFFEEKGIYPEVAQYLSKIESWDQYDASKVVWGVETREDFVNALSYALAPNLGSVLALLVGVCKDAYNEVLVPILESPHAGTFPDAKTFQKNAAIDGKYQYELYMKQVIEYILTAVDNVFQNPVNYVCEILPDFDYSFGYAMNYLHTCTGMLSMVVRGFRDSLPHNLNDVVKMVSGSLEEKDIKLSFDEFDEEKLIAMGKATTVESGRSESLRGNTSSYAMKIEGNKPLVFAAVSGYVDAFLQNESNRNAVEKLVADKISGCGDEFVKLVNASKNGSSYDVAKAASEFVSAVAESKAENTNPILAFFSKIIYWISQIALRVIEIFKW